MRTHEELLTFTSIGDTWKEIVGGTKANEDDIKCFSGHHDNATRDLKKMKNKMKRLRRKQETSCGALNGHLFFFAILMTVVACSFG